MILSTTLLSQIDDSAKSDRRDINKKVNIFLAHLLALLTAVVSIMGTGSDRIIFSTYVK